MDTVFRCGEVSSLMIDFGVSPTSFFLGLFCLEVSFSLVLEMLFGCSGRESSFSSDSLTNKNRLQQIYKELLFTFRRDQLIDCSSSCFFHLALAATWVTLLCRIFLLCGIFLRNHRLLDYIDFWCLSLVCLHWLDG